MIVARETCSLYRVVIKAERRRLVLGLEAGPPNGKFPQLELTGRGSSPVIGIAVLS
jgi:hypothetical protein